MKTLNFLLIILTGCANAPKSHVEIGESLKTEYFEVTVNSFELKDSINGYNPENGNVFLTLNVTYKNISDSVRVISEQGIGIQKDGHNYWLERDFVIETGGFGEKFVSVNPGESVLFKQAYQVPINISGDANYYPGRTNGKDLSIRLGKIEI